jgi:rSAM/selenodomain-associated transferase 2
MHGGAERQWQPCRKRNRYKGSSEKEIRLSSQPCSKQIVMEINSKNNGNWQGSMETSRMNESKSAERSLRLSIIIPVLNEAQHIVTLMQSLAPCRQAGAEIIVVDGVSEDQTVALATPYADRVLSAARGRARQMNAGADAAQGDMLLFLHADTLLPPCAYSLVLSGLSESGQLWGRFNVRIEGRSPMLKVIAWMMNMRSRLTGIATGDQAIFVRRDVFLEVGAYPDQPLMEDIELSHRLKKRGAPLCLRDKVTTSGRRWESRGVWRTISLMWTLRLRYWLGAPAEELARVYR